MVLNKLMSQRINQIRNIMRQMKIEVQHAKTYGMLQKQFSEESS